MTQSQHSPAVLFDLDGTLADTSRDLIEAANESLDRFGVSGRLDPLHDKAVAFRGGRAMLSLGYERSGTPVSHISDEIYRFFLEIYATHLDRYTSLFENVVPTLKNLQLEGYSLGVTTNKPEALAEELLKRLDIRQYFGALIGADTLPTRKPHPEPVFETLRRIGGTPEAAILVGDTITDREAARNANIYSILVSFGPEGKTVLELEPDAIIDHYDELIETARQLLASRKL